MKTLAKMTRAALKLWQIVARYTTKPLLCQGVEGDMAMAKNSRRVFADANTCSLSALGVEPKQQHIAFEDKCKLITPEKAALYAAPPSRVQVVALANWESAPTFVLDDHLGKAFPRVSSDRLLNKCNPFLSGKRRALSDDISSEAPTVSTDCSAAPENDSDDLELSVVREESDVLDDLEEIASATLNDEESSEDRATKEEVSTECKSSAVASTDEVAKPETGSDEMIEPKKKFQWVRVGSGRYVKRGAESTVPVAAKVSSKPKPANLPTTRWVQVGHGRYKKVVVNGDTLQYEDLNRGWSSE